MFAHLSYGAAIDAITGALTGGFDPADDIARTVRDVTSGQLLLMPSESSEFVGVKVVTVAPANPARGLGRIQGVYLLLDGRTLAPVALIDGVAVTSIRTPAVSAAAAELLAPTTIDHLVVFGCGPQARGHIDALRAVRELSRITIVGRNPERADAFADAVSQDGVQARVGTPDDVSDAQLIVCATSSSEPLFHGELVSDDSCIIAVGSHEPTVREIDGFLIGRAQIVVEDVATALREAGDVIIPIAEGGLDATTLVTLRQIVSGEVAVDADRPRIFKSVGMSWQDLVIAAAVYRPSVERAPAPH